MSVNFVSMGRQDIQNFSLVCKNTDIFNQLEERVYNEFPKFKEFNTICKVNSRDNKRFKTLDENGIKSGDIINIFVIEQKKQTNLISLNNQIKKIDIIISKQFYL